MQARAARAWRIRTSVAVAALGPASATVSFAASAFPPFDPTYFASHILWLAISFGALYWLMSTIALPRLGEVLTHRSAKIAADLDEAAEIHAKVQAVAKGHEDALAESRRNAQAIAQEAHATSARETEAKRKATEAELAVRLEQADKTIADRKAVAMSNVEALAAEAAAAIVAKLTGTSPSEAETAAAVGNALRN